MARKRILIIEDDLAIQDAMQMSIENAGYDVELHCNGEKILDGIYQLPDMFIVDKQLSGVDGVDICRHLKSEEKSCSIPVIMISASPQVEKLAIDAGASSFIEKPFKNAVLLENIKRFLAMD